MLTASIATGYAVELIVLFGIVIIHEFGHAVAAKGFGWRIREIRLLPFGGVAEVEEAGSVPAAQEFIVAIAGPLQNFLMIGIAWLFGTLGIWDEAWRDYFIQVNVMIGAFNLLPILPLDGGKILQALVSYWLPYHRVLQLVITVSLLLSSFMIAASLGAWYADGIQLNLLMIGIFLFISNWVDYQHLSFLYVRFLMGREQRIEKWIAGGVHARPIAVQESLTVPEVLKLLMREQFHLIYIYSEKGRMKRIVEEQYFLRAYLSNRKEPNDANFRFFSYNRRIMNEHRTVK